VSSDDRPRHVGFIVARYNLHSSDWVNSGLWRHRVWSSRLTVSKIFFNITFLTYDCENYLRLMMAWIRRCDSLSLAEVELELDMRSRRIRWNPEVYRPSSPWRVSPTDSAKLTEHSVKICQQYNGRILRCLLLSTSCHTFCDTDDLSRGKSGTTAWRFVGAVGLYSGCVC